MNQVNEITKDCFAAALQLKQMDGKAAVAPSKVQESLRTIIDQMMQKATQLGFNQQDTQDMAYAVVALIDELALSRPGEFRDFWMGQLLQFHYFRENLAGDGFFQRLQTIRSDRQRTDVLRVYYLCLMFGFQGRYRVRGGELELINLIESLQADLTRAGEMQFPEELSPQGQPPRSEMDGIRKVGPLLALSLGTLALSVLVYLALYFTLNHQVTSP